jgi:hypothetical protein
MRIRDAGAATEPASLDREGFALIRHESAVRYNPAHRWFYVPDMRTDEALPIKCFDSKTVGRARFAPHTAFRDPRHRQTYSHAKASRCAQWSFTLPYQPQ